MFLFQSVFQRGCGLVITVVTIATLLISTPVRAQFTAHVQTRDYTTVDQSIDVPLQIERDASKPFPTTPMFHILPANTEAGRRAALTGPAEAVTTQDDLAISPLLALAKPGFFPADLTNFGGGTVGSGSSEDIYYNCPGNNESCWGDPEGFLSNLSVSRFIHVLDQYVGLRSNKRYPLSNTFVFENGSVTNLNTADIETIVENAAALSEVGAGHIFHVFLPPGVDVCPDTNQCYSPDNPSTFVLCAYHSSISGSNILYTVEPYQDVVGCVLAPPNPNSAMIDSTNSALSHELFETISDPFIDAWIAENSSPEAGNEMADICHGPGNGSGEIIAPEYLLLKGHTYQTQLEYSNFRHGCVVSP